MYVLVVLDGNFKVKVKYVIFPISIRIFFAGLKHTSSCKSVTHDYRSILC